MLGSAFLIGIGVALLAISGDKLVDFACRLAAKLGLPPELIGLTVVAWGTSAPEFFVSITATLKGETEIAAANVIGSNTANLTLILGLAASLHPLRVSREVQRSHFPFLLTATLIAWFFGRDGEISRVEGAVFLAGMAHYTWKAYRQGLLAEAAEAQPTGPVRSLWILAAGTAASLAGLAVGARLLVAGAVSLALGWGVSERVIGLTIVAIGTSLPEMVATLSASRKGEHGMAVANLVGSNVFNLLGILGLCALIKPVPLSSALVDTDLPAMLAACVLMLPVTAAGWMPRWAGSLWAGAYFAYLAALGRSSG